MRKTVGAALAVYAMPAAALVSPPLARALGMQTRLGDRNAVALTFDDGPHPEGTPAILDKLDELGVSATFFLSGEQVVRYPNVAREVTARGHALGTHGFRHVLLSVRPPASTRSDLVRAVEAITHATGVTPMLYRPPYGVANAAVVLAARRAGLRTVLWSRWGRDWQTNATPSSVAALATRDLRGGEIVLLHDADHYGARGSWRPTLDALPLIAGAIARAGLEVSPGLGIP